MTVEVHGVEQLPDVARKLLEEYSEERFFAFFGKMGVGKTTLIKSLCSPTFAIINVYRSREGAPVYHFDFYRLKRAEEAYDIGYEEYFYSGEYCFTEWTEKVEELLPEPYVRIEMKENNGIRTITAEIIDD